MVRSTPCRRTAPAVAGGQLTVAAVNGCVRIRLGEHEIALDIDAARRFEERLLEAVIAAELARIAGG